MKKLLPTSLLLVLLLSSVYSQTVLNHTNNWYFNAGSGIDFSSGNAVNVNDGVLSTNEGCTSISDADGNLLFYSDGVTLYNANHLAMQNGTGLHGGTSASQSCIGVPQPGNENVWFLFTADQEGGADGAQYSVIDMSMDGGLGGVTDKNIALVPQVEEKVTTCMASNGTDYWVLFHGYDDKKFYAFPVTPSGVGSPVVSEAGTITTGLQPWTGCMKFSPDGSRIAVAKFDMKSFGIFDFNNTTGIVSYSFTVQFTGNFFAYGAEWSSNSKLLYLANVNAAGTIYQLDMSLPDTTAILSSLTLVGSTNDIVGTMQMARDGKIYVSPNNKKYLAVIAAPGVKGSGCNFISNGFSNAPNTNYIGLPNYVTSWLASPSASLMTVSTSLCEQGCIDFTDQSTGNAVSWKWDFPGANPSSSTDQHPISICYDAPGVYDVTLIATNAMGSDTITLNEYISVNASPSATVIQSNDTLYAPLAATYQWYNNGNAIAGATNFYYVPSAEGEYSVVITDENGCTGIDSILFSLAPVAGFYSNPQELCEKFCTGFYDQSSNNPTTWLWQFPGGAPASSGDQNPSAVCYSNPGSYDVTLITTNGYGSDTLVLADYITVHPTPPIPTIIQNGNTLTSSSAATYQWQFNTVNIPGATNQSYTVTQPGFYGVVVTDSNGCQNSASMNVEITGIAAPFTDPLFSIYPNPSDGHLNIVMNDEMMTNAFIEVRNVLGELIFYSGDLRLPSTAPVMKTTLDLSHLAGGIYFIEVVSGNGSGSLVSKYGRKRIVIDR